MEILCKSRSMSIHDGPSYLQPCDGPSSCMSAGSLSNLFSCGSSSSRPRAGRWRRQRRCSMARMPSKRSYNRQRLVTCATIPRSKNRVHDTQDTRLFLSQVCAPLIPPSHVSTGKLFVYFLFAPDFRCILLSSVSLQLFPPRDVSQHASVYHTSKETWAGQCERGNLQQAVTSSL